MSKKDIKNKKPLPRSTRLGLMLIALLAVMILVVSIITASYSWFLPKTQKGTGITYQTDVHFRGEDCTVTQFQGTKASTGEISYAKIDNPTTVSVTKGTVGYFMTTVTNNDTKYPTVVSVYMSQFPEAARSIGFGIAAPSNSFREFSSVQNDFYFVRNAFITPNDNSEAATLSVEWFVDATKATNNVTIDLRKMYIMFN